MDKKRVYCDEMLKAMMGDELAARWWDSPNKAFDNQTPHLVYTTDPDKVYDYLIWHAFCAGG